MTVAVHLAAMGQNYDVNDTTSEYSQKGTFYHNKFEGRKTACGEIFDQNLFTAAHWKIKMGTYVLVTNKNSGLQVIVKINDRCPKKGVIDMTHRAANAIGIRGCQPVKVRILPPGYEDLCEAQDAKFDSVKSRFASGQYALAAPSTKAKSSTPSKATKHKEAKPAAKQQQKAPASATTSGDHYNLVLATVQSHGEAFELIQKLPEPYREKTLIDTSDSTTFTLILDVHLDKKKAQELSRALRHTFNGCKITPSE